MLKWVNLVCSPDRAFRVFSYTVADGMDYSIVRVFNYKKFKKSGTKTGNLVFCSSETIRDGRCLYKNGQFD